MGEYEDKIRKIIAMWKKTVIPCPHCSDVLLDIEKKDFEEGNWVIKGECPKCGWGFRWTKEQDEEMKKKKSKGKKK